MQEDQDYSQDGFDDVFGANSQHPHRFIFISTNNVGMLYIICNSILIQRATNYCEYIAY
jgi:hypothetical protein